MEIRNTQADERIEVTHHCVLIDMNEDPEGELYSKILNRSEKNVDVVIMQREVSTTKDGKVQVVLFYDVYTRHPKPKNDRKRSIREGF